VSTEQRLVLRRQGVCGSGGCSGSGRDAAPVSTEQRLQRLADLATPVLADWCVVHLIRGSAVDEIAVAHTDPAKREFVREIQRRYPPDPRGTSGPIQVARTGRVVFVPELTDDMLRASVEDPEHLELLRQVGMRSAMIVPLAVPGRVLGALTLITADSGRVLDDADLAFAQDLAQRAALARENARLYEQTAAPDRAHPADRAAARRPSGHPRPDDSGPVRPERRRDRGRRGPLRRLPEPGRLGDGEQLAVTDVAVHAAGPKRAPGSRHHSGDEPGEGQGQPQVDAAGSPSTALARAVGGFNEHAVENVGGDETISLRDLLHRVSELQRQLHGYINKCCSAAHLEDVGNHPSDRRLPGRVIRDRLPSLGPSLSRCSRPDRCSLELVTGTSRSGRSRGAAVGPDCR